jgi:hypothetical protein
MQENPQRTSLSIATSPERNWKSFGKNGRVKKLHESPE